MAMGEHTVQRSGGYVIRHAHGECCETTPTYGTILATFRQHSENVMTVFILQHALLTDTK